MRSHIVSAIATVCILVSNYIFSLAGYPDRESENVSLLPNPNDDWPE